MSKMILIEEAKLTSVLEALEWNMDYLPSHGHGTSMASKAISALREALAEQCVCGEPETSGTHRIDGPCYAEQPAQRQEPVYWQWRRKDQPWSLEYTFNSEVQVTTKDSERRALYTSPQPTQQQSSERGEPKAYIHRQGNHWEVSERMLLDDEKARGWTEEPLYTSPPAQRTWVGLTDDERLEVAEIDGSDEWFWKVCKAIEAKLREKNT